MDHTFTVDVKTEYNALGLALVTERVTKEAGEDKVTRERTSAIAYTALGQAASSFLEVTERDAATCSWELPAPARERKRRD